MSKVVEGFLTGGRNRIVAGGIGETLACSRALRALSLALHRQDLQPGGVPLEGHAGIEGCFDKNSVANIRIGSLHATAGKANGSGGVRQKTCYKSDYDITHLPHLKEYIFIHKAKVVMHLSDCSSKDPLLGRLCGGWLLTRWHLLSDWRCSECRRVQGSRHWIAHSV